MQMLLNGAWVDRRQRLEVRDPQDAHLIDTVPQASAADMDCLYLREDVRGFGLGRLLMREIAHQALNLGCVQVQWQTPALNGRGGNG